MSARIKMRVLRVPCEKVGVKDPWAFGEAHSEDFPAEGPYPYFAVAPTVRGFIDYVLSEQISQKKSFGRTRKLTFIERKKYASAFQKLFPQIDMHDVRLVVFCWYNGCEAPDYYE